MVGSQVWEFLQICMIEVTSAFSDLAAAIIWNALANTAPYIYQKTFITPDQTYAFICINVELLKSKSIEYEHVLV